jgi:hypothetical protein
MSRPSENDTDGEDIVNISRCGLNERFADSAHVCSICGDFLLTGNQDQYNPDATLSQIEDSAVSGCEYCWAILKAVKHFFLEEQPLRLASRVKIGFWNETKLPSVVIQYDGPFTGFEEILFYRPPGESMTIIRAHFTAHSSCRGLLKLYTEARDSWTNMPIANHVSENTSSIEALSIAKTWLRECIIDPHHQKCKELRETASLPSRTLRINESNDHIYVSQNKPGAKGVYICLSHCWGAFQPLRLLKSSYQALTQNVPWDNLPKTFQDAIIVCRTFGASHLWIDSLCIIQDDRDDWAIESARMASIYTNGMLTIAAAASIDGCQGCLGKRTSARDQLFEIPPPLPLDKTRNYRGVWARMNKHLSLESLPLLGRAWVLQERQLSRRMLYFNEHEMAWKCLSKELCECGESSPLDFGFNAITKDSWMGVVETYSHLQLTNHADKLPALSGMAHAYREEHGDTIGQYLAGIWSSVLISQLCWCTWATPDCARSGYRAPSWSWAASDQHVRFLDIDKPDDTYDWKDGAIHFYHAEVLSARCIPSTLNQYGQISQAHLTLRTMVLSARLSYLPLNPPFRLWGQLKFGVLSQEDPLDELKIRSSDSALTVIGGNEVRLDFIPSELEAWNRNAEGVANMNAVCAIISWTRPKRELENRGMYFATLLVLVPCNPASTTFRRIGIYQTRTSADASQLFNFDIPMADQFRMSTITIV